MMRKLFLVILVLAVAMACSSLAVAQTYSSYSVTHNYWFTGVAGLPAISQFNYMANARAWEPAPGLDTDFRNGSWAIVGPGSFGLQARAGTDRPKAGFGDAGATAGLSAAVNTWGGGLWRASMTSYGSAHALWWPDWANASSSMNTRIWAPRGWGFGRIVWRPVIQDNVSGAAWASGQRWRPIRNYDPIQVSGMDALGNPIWTESFFDVNFEASGDVDWGDTGGMVVHDPAGQVDMLLELGTHSGFVTNPGSLTLEVRDGWVTQSDSSGRFAGVGLPSVGTFIGGTLSLPGLSNEFDFDYDLNSLQGDQFEFLLDGGGSGDATGVPEPGSLLALGSGLTGLAGMVIRRRR